MKPAVFSQCYVTERHVGVFCRCCPLKPFPLLLIALVSLSFPFHNAAAANSTPQAAQSKTWWALQPLREITPPEPKDKSRVRTPIDAFVFAKVEQSRLTPTRPAERLALLRRAYFDLVGLPPPLEEIESFSKSKQPDAYQQLIERLLASPSYGERWGRHWLDVVRYADTGGFEADPLYEQAWRYRDYVIRSFNADKPFDRFIEEQVAGDELWPDNPEAVIATGVYSIGPVMEESAMVSNQLEYEWLTDAADTTGAAFLGLTLGCARCHNHKYYPISQKDYFAVQAIFAASDRVYPEKIRERRIKAINGLLADKPLPKELENDSRCAIRIEKDLGMRLVHLDSPIEIHRLHRGELSKPRETVAPGFPEALQYAGQRDLTNVPPGQRRAALAHWLTSPRNPLTARVIVNRVWAWHFGNGLVRTPNDFGKQGEAPTHPELLDWLARDFMAHGWSLKHLHRLIMLSSTYQMASVGDSRGKQIDLDDHLLWSFPRRRLEAEAIWDNLHACAGTLNPKQFGPPVVPPLTDEELTGLFSGKAKWPVTKDASEHTRRGVYLLVRRIFLFPFLDGFDPPEVMTSCSRRLETTVPTQALTLLNSRIAREQAQAFAERLLREAGPQPKAFLRRAWLLAFGRPITGQEMKRAEDFLRRRETALRASASSSRANADAPKGAARERALADLCLALFNANEFIYVD